MKLGTWPGMQQFLKRQDRPGRCGELCLIERQGVYVRQYSAASLIGFLVMISMHCTVASSTAASLHIVQHKDLQDEMDFQRKDTVRDERDYHYEEYQENLEAPYLHPKLDKYGNAIWPEKKQPATQKEMGVFVLETEDDVKSMLKLHATKAGEVMLTTFTLTHHGQSDDKSVIRACHIWENLREINRLNNSLLITYDLHTCQLLWKSGIPCFLDRFLPQPSNLPGQYEDDNPYYFQKHAWALIVLRMGYSLAFFETDQIFLKDPLAFRNPSLDLEGLSDWRRASVPNAMERILKPCKFYQLEGQVDGDPLLGVRGDEANQPDNSPCMSTSFWSASPSKAAIEFFESLLDLMVHQHADQNEKALFNEILPAFLIGQGHRRQLHASLFDTGFFSNIDVWILRKQQGLPIDPVMLHCGHVAPQEKESIMRHHGFWKADNWTKDGAKGHIENLSKLLQRRLPQKPL